MPYRRLPNTDQARIRALKAVVVKGDICKMCIRDRMEEVMKAAGSDMAVLVKMNMRDGFRGGMELDETMQVDVYKRQIRRHPFHCRCRRELW